MQERRLSCTPFRQCASNLAKVCHALHKDEETDTLLKAAWKEAGYDEKVEILEFLGKISEEKQLYKESADYYRRARAMQDSARMARNTEVLVSAQKNLDHNELERKLNERNKLTLWTVVLVAAVIGQRRTHTTVPDSTRRTRPSRTDNG